ncbi:MAG: ATP-binding protein [Bacillota bacterium]
MHRKRITIITGHYGAGKSEIAIELAIAEPPFDMLVDLDVVNPYFRSRSAEATLSAHGVELITSPLGRAAGSDLPYIPARGREPFINKDIRAVYDLAGNTAGAKLMMQYTDVLEKEEAMDFLFVVNVYRPETSSVSKIKHAISMVEAASQIKVSGLINNSNLMDETEEAHLMEGERLISEVANDLNIPIVLTCHDASWTPKHPYKGELLSLKRYVKSG